MKHPSHTDIHFNPYVAGTMTLMPAAHLLQCLPTEEALAFSLRTPAHRAAALTPTLIGMLATKHATHNNNTPLSILDVFVDICDLCCGVVSQGPCVGRRPNCLPCSVPRHTFCHLLQLLLPLLEAGLRAGARRCLGAADCVQHTSVDGHLPRACVAMWFQPTRCWDSTTRALRKDGTRWGNH